MKKLLLLAAISAAMPGVADLSCRSALAQTKDKADPKPAAPQKIAVIDLQRVFMESHQFQKMREEYKELTNAKQQKIEQLQQQKIAVVQDVREQQLEPDSDELISKEEEVIRIETSMKTLTAVAKQQLSRRQLEINAEMYAVVHKALDKFAETNGYSFVLNAHELTEDSDNANELQSVIWQPVSWHRNREDITDAVVQYLNSRYDAAADVQPAGASGTGKSKTTTAEGTRSTKSAGASAGTGGAKAAAPQTPQPKKSTNAPARKSATK